MPKVTRARGAQTTGTGENGGDRERTRRLVLRRIHAIEVPAEAEGKTHEEVAAILAKLVRKGTVDAWVECGEHEGSVVQAIESHAGKPGTPDAKVGTFKAPSARSMKGGVRYTQPALPKVEREVL